MAIDLTGLMEKPLELKFGGHSISVPPWTKEVGLFVSAFWQLMYKVNLDPEGTVCADCGQTRPTGQEAVDGLIHAYKDREIEEVVLSAPVFEQLNAEGIGEHDLYNIALYVVQYRLIGEASANEWLKSTIEIARGDTPKGHRKQSKSGPSTE